MGPGASGEQACKGSEALPTRYRQRPAAPPHSSARQRKGVWSNCQRGSPPRLRQAQPGMAQRGAAQRGAAQRDAAQPAAAQRGTAQRGAARRSAAQRTLGYVLLPFQPVAEGDRVAGPGSAGAAKADVNPQEVVLMLIIIAVAVGVELYAPAAPAEGAPIRRRSSTGALPPPRLRPAPPQGLLGARPAPARAMQNAPPPQPCSAAWCSMRSVNAARKARGWLTRSSPPRGTLESWRTLAR